MFGLFLFGLLGILFGLFGLLVIKQTISERRKIKSWVETVGDITDLSCHSRDYNHKGVYYTCTCVVNIDGLEYRKSLELRYKPSSTIVVYYNPDDNEEVLIGNPVNGAPLGVLLLVISVGILKTLIDIVITP